MVTRDDLDRARELLAEIVRKNNRLEVMHSRVTGGAINYHEKVQESVSNSQEALLTCMVDLEKELSANKTELRELQKEIKAWAKMLPLPEKQVIMMRYIACMEWNEITDCMAYSPRQVFRFHGDAVKRLSPKNK